MAQQGFKHFILYFFFLLSIIEIAGHVVYHQSIFFGFFLHVAVHKLANSCLSKKICLLDH